jgi:hypothetical protein
MECIKCWKDSGRSKFCRKCREIKQNAGSIVSQNKSKLIKLLQWDYLTPEWFEKFILYSNNIISYGKIVMEYKEVDTRRTFENIMKFWIITVNIISLLFIAEIVIVEL